MLILPRNGPLGNIFAPGLRFCVTSDRFAAGDAAPVANALDSSVEEIAYLGDISVYNIRLDSRALVRVARTNRFPAFEDPIAWEALIGLS